MIDENGSNREVAPDVGSLVEEPTSPTFHPIDTTSPAFQAWFRASRAVDADGSPLRLYHGTRRTFGAFLPVRSGAVSLGFGDVEVERHGIFFAEDPGFSSEFAAAGAKGGLDGGQILPVHLSIQNPLWIDDATHAPLPEHAARLVAVGVNEKWVDGTLGDPRETWEAFDGDVDGKWWVDKLREAGFDGMRMLERSPETGTDHVVWVALDPTQIKSAVANTGAFSLNDPDVMFQRPAPAPTPTSAPRSPQAADGPGQFTLPNDIPDSLPVMGEFAATADGTVYLGLGSGNAALARSDNVPASAAILPSLRLAAARCAPQESASDSILYPDAIVSRDGLLYDGLTIPARTGDGAALVPVVSLSSNNPLNILYHEVAHTHLREGRFRYEELSAFGDDGLAARLRARYDIDRYPTGRWGEECLCHLAGEYGGGHGDGGAVGRAGDDVGAGTAAGAARHRLIEDVGLTPEQVSVLDAFVSGEIGMRPSNADIRGLALKDIGAVGVHDSRISALPPGSGLRPFDAAVSGGSAAEAGSPVPTPAPQAAEPPPARERGPAGSHPPPPAQSAAEPVTMSDQPASPPPSLPRQATPFYSALTRAVSTLPQTKAPATQWRGILANLKGVKAEELAWSGVFDWLDGRGDESTTRADVLEYVAANEVTVDELLQGAAVISPDEADAQLRAARSALEADARRHGVQPEAIDAIFTVLDEMWDSPDAEARAGVFARDGAVPADLRESALAYLDARDRIEAASDDSSTKFSEYTLSGGEKYRELLLVLPRPRVEVAGTRFDEGKGGYIAVDADGRDMTTGAWETEELAAKVAATVAPLSRRDAVYRSTHWLTPNVLAHVRFDEREGPNGERVLHIAEIQSDWHQTGRRQGYQGVGEDMLLTALPDGYTIEETDAPSGKMFRVYDRDYRPASPWGYNREGTVNSVINALNDRIRAEHGLTGTPVPDAPFKTTWHEMAFRRMVRFAAENGFDRLSWDTGTTNADRYDLGKRVDQIRYVKRGDDSFDVWAARSDGSAMSDELDWRHLTADEISARVGKSVAAKIINDEGIDDPENPGDRVLSGVDLRIGGDGMQAFYDRMLPSYAGKFGRQFGAAVESSTTAIDGGERRYVGPERSADWLRDFAKRQQDEFDRTGQGGLSEFEKGGVARAISLLEGGKPFAAVMEDVAVKRLALLVGGDLQPVAESVSVHTMPITPAMRDVAVQVGFPLFQRPAPEYMSAAFREIPLDALTPPAGHPADRQWRSPGRSLVMVPLARNVVGVISQRSADEMRAAAISETIAPLAERMTADATVAVFEAIYDTSQEVPVEVTGLTACRLSTDGVRHDFLIAISARAEDPARTLAHEALHYVKRSECLTSDEYSTLERNAAGWTERFGIADRYGAEGSGVYSEESCADALATYAEHVWGGLRDGAAGRGSRSGDDSSAAAQGVDSGFPDDVRAVFDRILSGEVGDRYPARARALDGLADGQYDALAFKRDRHDSRTLDMFAAAPLSDSVMPNQTAARSVLDGAEHSGGESPDRYTNDIRQGRGLGELHREHEVRPESQGVFLRLGDQIGGGEPRLDTEDEGGRDVSGVARRSLDSESTPVALSAASDPVSDVGEVHRAVARQFGIEPEAVAEIDRLAPQVFQDRDRYLAPSNTDVPTDDFPRLPLGSVKIAYHNDDPGDAYIDILRRFDPNEITHSESEDGIKERDPSYQRYVQWFKEGREAPPISVFDNRNYPLPVSANRRRVLAAREAGVKSILGWYGPHNAATGLPLKLRDVKAALAAATQTLSPTAVNDVADTSEVRDPAESHDTDGTQTAIDQVPGAQKPATALVPPAMARRDDIPLGNGPEISVTQAVPVVNDALRASDPHDAGSTSVVGATEGAETTVEPSTLAAVAPTSLATPLLTTGEMREAAAAAPRQPTQPPSPATISRFRSTFDRWSSITAGQSYSPHLYAQMFAIQVGFAAGVESLAAVHPSGRVDFATSHHRSKVTFPAAVAAAVADPNSGITLHHNHGRPWGSASVDLCATLLPGVSHVVTYFPKSGDLTANDLLNPSGDNFHVASLAINPSLRPWVAAHQRISQNVFTNIWDHAEALAAIEDLADPMAPAAEVVCRRNDTVMRALAALQLISYNSSVAANDPARIVAVASQLAASYGVDYDTQRGLFASASRYLLGAPGSAALLPDPTGGLLEQQASGRFVYSDETRGGAEYSGGARPVPGARRTPEISGLTEGVLNVTVATQLASASGVDDDTQRRLFTSASRHLLDTPGGAALFSEPTGGVPERPVPGQPIHSAEDLGGEEHFGRAHSILRARRDAEDSGLTGAASERFRALSDRVVGYAVAVRKLLSDSSDRSAAPFVYADDVPSADFLAVSTLGSIRAQLPDVRGFATPQASYEVTAIDASSSPLLGDLDEYLVDETTFSLPTTADIAVDETTAPASLATTGATTGEAVVSPPSPSAIDESRAAYRAATRAEAEAEDARALAARDTDGFVSGMLPMQAVRAERALLTNVRNDGRVISRRDLIREMVAAGSTLAVDKHGMDRLVWPDGSFLDSDQLTKTGIAYARHLISMKAASGATEEPGHRAEDTPPSADPRPEPQSEPPLPIIPPEVVAALRLANVSDDDIQHMSPDARAARITDSEEMAKAVPVRAFHARGDTSWYYLAKGEKSVRYTLRHHSEEPRRPAQDRHIRTFGESFDDAILKAQIYIAAHHPEAPPAIHTSEHDSRAFYEDSDSGSESHSSAAGLADLSGSASSSPSPAGAALHQPSPGTTSGEAAPASPKGDALSTAGLKIKRNVSRAGRPYWSVSGNLDANRDLLDRLGAAAPYASGKTVTRSFFDGDPTERITAALVAGEPTDPLAKAGLIVSERIGRSGKPFWEIRGRIEDHEALLNAFGAAPVRWFGGVASRTIFSGDPTEKLTAALGGNVIPNVMAERPTIDAEAARRVVAARRLFVDQDTKAGGFVVSGKTFDYRGIMNELGGRFDKAINAYRFDADPLCYLGATLKAIDEAGSVASLAGGDKSRGIDDEIARHLLRLREEESARVSRERPALDTVGVETQALIRRGLEFGLSDSVVADQIEDVAMMKDAWSRRLPLFLLANAAGTGKTFCLGGAIRELREAGQERFVYLTRSQDLIEQIKRDLEPYGLDGVEFHTYAELSNKKSAQIDAYGAVVISDEAHDLKNVMAARGEKGQYLLSGARMVVLASATLFENPVEARYLDATGVFREVGGFEIWALMYGAARREETVVDRKTGRDFTVTTIYWPANASKADIKAARDWFMSRGIMTQRQIQIDPSMVESEFRRFPVSQEYVDLYETVVAAYDDALAPYVGPDGAGGGAEIARHRENTLKRILEAAKLPGAIELAKEFLAEGKRVAVFSETKSERELGRWRMLDAKPTDPTYAYPEMAVMMAEWDRARALARIYGEDAPPPPFAQFVFEIAKAFHDRGVHFTLPSPADEVVSAFPKGAVAVYTGAVTQAKAAKAKDEFRSGAKKIMVLTMEKGGTGLSLHDTVGDKPTVQLNLTLPWTATKVEQVSARTARYGLQSTALVAWLFASNIPWEAEKLAPKVGRRMAEMGALVKGIEVKAAEMLTSDFDFEGVVDVRDTADVAFSRSEAPLVAPPFYSALSRAVAALRQTRAPASQWRGMLANLKGVKAEEVAWSGVLDWLDARGEQATTKDDVLDHLAANEVVVEEVLKGARGEDQWVAEDETPPAAEDEVTKYADYVLDGGSNYRELLLTLPVERVYPDVPDYEDWLRDEPWFISGAGGDDDRARELYAEWSEREKIGRDAPTFKSSHWAERNVLAHVRFDEHEGPDGERVLHIAEIQSDWHQAGRKRGYRGASPLTDVPADLRVAAVRKDDGRWAVEDARGVPEDDRAFVHEADAQDAAAQANARILRELNDVNRVPDAPFKTTWHELAFRRMVRYAAENGFDRLSWDTGATNAARYDLTKRLDRLHYTAAGGELRGFKDGKIVIVKSGVTPEKLADEVGKDAAEKLLSDEHTSFRGTASQFSEIVGDDLKAGGSGMLGFYDKMLPSYAGKYVKKWGAKTESVELVLSTGRVYVGPDLSMEWTAHLSEWVEACSDDGDIVSADDFLSMILVREAMLGGANFAEAMTRFADDHVATLAGGRFEEKTATTRVHSIAITSAMRETAIRDGFPLFRRQVPGHVLPYIEIPRNALQRPVGCAPGQQWRAGDLVMVPLASNVVGVISQKAAHETRIAGIADGLAPLASRLTPNAAVEVYDAIFDTGRIDPVEVDGVTSRRRDAYGPTGDVRMAISARSDDPARTLAHEALHYLQLTRALTYEEHATLQRHAADWIGRFRILERYRNDLPASHSDESIAEAFATYARIIRGDLRTGPGWAGSAASLHPSASPQGVALSFPADVREIFDRILSGDVGDRRPAREAGLHAAAPDGEGTAFARDRGDVLTLDLFASPPPSAPPAAEPPHSAEPMPTPPPAPSDVLNEAAFDARAQSLEARLREAREAGDRDRERLVFRDIELFAARYAAFYNRPATRTEEQARGLDASYKSALLLADPAIWEAAIWAAATARWDAGEDVFYGTSLKAVRVTPNTRSALRFAGGRIEFYDGKRNGRERWCALGPTGQAIDTLAHGLGLPTSWERFKASSDVAAADAAERFKAHILIAADSVENLLRADVERVIGEIDEASREDFAGWLREGRPDLAGEIDGVMDRLEAATSDVTPDTIEFQLNHRLGDIAVDGSGLAAVTPETLRVTLARMRDEDGWSDADVAAIDAYVRERRPELFVSDLGVDAGQHKPESPSTPAGAAVDVDAMIQHTVHAKKGFPVHVVTLAERVDRAVYDELLAEAKALGGWYSSFRGKGAIPGFQFKKLENARTFAVGLSVRLSQSVTSATTEASATAAEDDASTVASAAPAADGTVPEPDMVVAASAHADAAQADAPQPPPPALAPADIGGVSVNGLGEADIASMYAAALGTAPNEYHQRFAQAILRKDAYALEHLANGLNDKGKKVFSDVTGVRLPKQQGATLDALLAWGGISRESHAVREARKAVDRAKREHGAKADGTEEAIRRLYQEGYTQWVRAADGKFWLINNKTEKGINLSAKGGARFQHLAKAVIEHEHAVAAEAASSSAAAEPPAPDLPDEVQSPTPGATDAAGVEKRQDGASVDRVAAAIATRLVANGMASDDARISASLTAAHLASRAARLDGTTAWDLYTESESAADERADVLDMDKTLREQPPSVRRKLADLQVGLGVVFDDAAMGKDIVAVIGARMAGAAGHADWSQASPCGGCGGCP